VETFSSRATTLGYFGLAFVDSIFVSQVLLCRSRIIMKGHGNEEFEPAAFAHCHRRDFADISQDCETALSHREALDIYRGNSSLARIGPLVALNW
jgi:hypothetical protein